MPTLTLSRRAKAFPPAHTVFVAFLCVASMLQHTAKQAQQQVLHLYRSCNNAPRVVAEHAVPLTKQTSFCCAASAPDTASLGRTGLTVSSLGIGTLQWGDTQCGYGKQYDEVCIRFQLNKLQSCPNDYAQGLAAGRVECMHHRHLTQMTGLLQCRRSCKACFRQLSLAE